MSHVSKRMRSIKEKLPAGKSVLSKRRFGLIERHALGKIP